MDIETLFKKFEERKVTIGDSQKYGIWWKDVEEIFDELKTEVVKIPQEIADWIEFFKERGCTLQESTIPGAYYGISILHELVDKFPTICFSDILLWILKNSETYTRAWIEGYEVEEKEEKRYLVKLKATNQYLHVDSFNKASFLPLSISSFGTEVTKTMLDNLGLGEAFTNPLFEVEEVK